MSELDRIKRNVAKMATQNAPPEEIDDYISSEGFTVDQVREHRIAAPKAEQPVDPTKAQARERVMKERAESPFMTAVDDTVRRLARGTGIGSWLDEGNARLASVLPEALGGRPYEEALAYERAKNEIGDEESSVVGSLPLIGDVSVGGLTKLAGGLVSAPITPMARVFGGATMLPRVGNAAVTGAGYGALYGAGEGETGGERAMNALAGGALGAGIGAIAPPVAAGVGNAIRATADRAAALPQALQGYSRGAVNRLADTARMDNATVGNYMRQGRELGPEGMLADMGDNMTLVAEGLVQQPGPARAMITEALEQRSQAAPQRIRSAINTNMGPAANIPQTLDNLRQTYGAQAAPLYDTFYQTPIPFNRPLGTLYQRALASGAVRNAQRLMQIDGFDPAALSQRNLTGREWDYIKRGIDDLAQRADRAGSREGLRRFSTLSQEIRDQVDRAISPNDPAQSIWRQAREVAGEGIGLRESIDEGRQAFSRGVTVDQLRADQAGRSAVEREAYRIGAREQVRANMDNAATNFGPSGDRAARRMLNSDENRRKMAEIAGPQEAQNINRAVDAENRMAETFNQVTGNSATARRQAVRDIIPRQMDDTNLAQVRQSSLSGIAMEGAMRVFNAVTANALNERNARLARDMADMLVARGVPRDQIAQGLIAVMQRQNATQAQRAVVSSIAQDIMRGAIPAAVEAQSGP